MEDDVGDSSNGLSTPSRRAPSHAAPGIFRAAWELRFADPEDSLQHTALLLQIAAWLESNANASCSIYVMSPGAQDRYRTRTRDDKVENFFQGANPSQGAGQGSMYPGDHECDHPTDLTIQVHTFDLRPHTEADDQTVYPRVSVIATYVPAAMGKDGRAVTWTCWIYFARLRPSTEVSNAIFGVASVPGLPQHRIGKDGFGAPALIIRVAPGASLRPARLYFSILLCSTTSAAGYRGRRGLTSMTRPSPSCAVSPVIEACGSTS